MPRVKECWNCGPEVDSAYPSGIDGAPWGVDERSVSNRTMNDNEVLLRRALRIFRNGMVGCVRARLTSKFGNGAETQLASLFGKKEPATEITQWQRMHLNAKRARATPEVSTTVADGFELIGVSDFHNVFEKFFTELAPAPVGEDASVLSDRRKGLLRCLQQIKAFRDPNAHEVSEAIDSDSLMLCVLNCKKVCQGLGLDDAHASLDELHKEAVDASTAKHALVIRFSDELETLELGQRCLALAGASAEIIAAKEFLADGRIASLMTETQNFVLVVAAATTELNSDEAEALDRVLATCERKGIAPLTLLSRKLQEPQIESTLSAAALRAFKRSARLLLVEAYARATGDELRTLLKPGRPRRSPRPPAPSVVVGHAIHDARLASIVFNQIRDPQLTTARIVAPFATDMRFGALGQISDAMIEAKKRGCVVCLITRPPSAQDADVAAKRILLGRLRSEEIDLYLNPLLHSKVYLFERQAERKFWAVGSHNLTNFAHGGKSLETSMVGYRAQEFEEAQTSFERARRHANTLHFDAWTAQQMRAGG